MLAGSAVAASLVRVLMAQGARRCLAPVSQDQSDGLGEPDEQATA